MKEVKTNVMRILEQHKIAYQAHEYPHGKEAVDGVSVAALLGQNEEQVFKTLVARGKTGGLYVFVVPVAAELEKSMEMIHVKELPGLTGYVRGGCSPVGLKKPYPVCFHESALAQPTIIVSAGKIGYQIETAPADLIALVHGKTADITV